MSSSQTITPLLPVLGASKNASPSADIKVNNTFNQVFKNEVASKVKKAPTEPLRNPIPHNQKPVNSSAPKLAVKDTGSNTSKSTGSSTSTSTSTSTNTTEKVAENKHENVQADASTNVPNLPSKNKETQSSSESNIDTDDTKKDEQVLPDLNDPTFLLNFVNNINALSLPNRSSNTSDMPELVSATEVSASVIANSASASIPMASPPTSNAISGLNSEQEAEGMTQFSMKQSGLSEILPQTQALSLSNTVTTSPVTATQIDSQTQFQAPPMTAPVTDMKATSLAQTSSELVAPLNQQGLADTAKLDTLALNKQPGQEIQANRIGKSIAAEPTTALLLPSTGLADATKTDTQTLNNAAALGTQSIQTIKRQAEDIKQPALTPIKSGDQEQTSVERLQQVSGLAPISSPPAPNNIGAANLTASSTLVSESKKNESNSQLASDKAQALSPSNDTKKTMLEPRTDLSTQMQNSFALGQSKNLVKDAETVKTTIDQEIPLSSVFGPPIADPTQEKSIVADPMPAAALVTPVASEANNTKASHGLEKPDSPLIEVSSNAMFSAELKSQFVQTKQEQVVRQESVALDAFAVNAMTTEVVAPLPSIQAPPTVISSLPMTEHIAARFGTKAWDQAIGQKIVWMVAGGEQTAQLTLNPPDLGPVQVVLSISDNFVDASFVSSHLDVREAIEAAAPKLREMMDNAGISLSGFSVSADSAQSGNAFNSEKSQQSNNSQHRNTLKTADESDSAAANAPIQRPKQDAGLVDTFA